MEEKEYLEQRLNDQIKWYDKKSGHSQKWYKAIRLVEIICAATFPFCLALLNWLEAGGIGQSCCEDLLPCSG